MAGLGDFASALSSAGGAVSSLFGAKGARESGASYDEAAGFALRNRDIARQATAIKQAQDERNIFKTIGKQRAQIGEAGFAESGTALDLLADSASQGALTKALTTEQGVIAENSYAEQAAQFSGLSASARSSATGQEFGGVLSLAAAGLSGYSALGGSAGIAALFSSAGSGEILDAGITAVAVA